MQRHQKTLLQLTTTQNNIVAHNINHNESHETKILNLLSVAFEQYRTNDTSFQDRKIFPLKV